MDIAVENYDLVEKTSRLVSRRFRLPRWMDNDLVSAGNEAIVRAAADPEIEGAVDVRPWLVHRIYFGIIDALRTTYGYPGFSRYEAGLRSVSLDAPLGDGDETALEVAAPGDVFDDASAAETLREILDACPTDRHREVVIRAAAGEPGAQIGRELGVSESRVSQMLSLVRRRLDHGRGWADPFYPPGSWR